MATFKPNKRNLDRFQRELQQELDQRPVTVPVQADPSAILPPATTVNNYHGPIVTVTGDGAQITWDNDGAVTQAQGDVQQVAPGYEKLAELITDLLASVDALGLEPADAEEVRSSAGSVLGEVVREEPDRGAVRRGVTMLKGLLAPIATGAAAGVSGESAEAARQVIDALGTSLAF